MAINPPVIEFYSGSQVTVFINDIWVDDTASYTINVSQNKQPIYGYGSQHYDFVAQGKIIVSGQITINYKDPNYLWLILGYRDAKRYTKEIAKKKDFAAEVRGEMGDPENIIKKLRNSEGAEFKQISELFKEDYWQTPSQFAGVISEEPLNHNPFDFHFLYKGDGAGVIERIEGVELMGNGKVVESNGQPIQETYNFIARKFR